MEPASVAVGWPVANAAGLSRRVRDAIRFLRANARSHVRLEDVAAAATLTPRGLQAAFRRELGTSPMEYLRGIRLEGVHRDLQRPEDGRRRTVAEVAHHWRFSNVGRMATAYRAVYGNAPSTTLRFLPDTVAEGADDVAVAGPGGTDADAPATARPLRAVDDDGAVGHAGIRLVLDCAIEVDDPALLRRSIEAQVGEALAVWPSSGSVDGSAAIVASLLTRALRAAASEVAGLSLRSVDTVVREPAVTPRG